MHLQLGDYKLQSPIGYVPPPPSRTRRLADLALFGGTALAANEAVRMGVEHNTGKSIEGHMMDAISNLAAKYNKTAQATMPVISGKHMGLAALLASALGVGAYGAYHQPSTTYHMAGLHDSPVANAVANAFGHPSSAQDPDGYLHRAYDSVAGAGHDAASWLATKYKSLMPEFRDDANSPAVPEPLKIQAPWSPKLEVVPAKTAAVNFRQFKQLLGIQ